MRLFLLTTLFFVNFSTFSQRNKIKKYDNIIEESTSIHYLPIAFTKEINSKSTSKKDTISSLVNKHLIDSILTKIPNKKKFIELKLDTASTKALKKDFYRIYKAYNDENDFWINAEKTKIQISDFSANSLSKAGIRFLLIFQIEGSYFEPQFKKQAQKEEFNKNLARVTTGAVTAILAPQLTYFLPAWQFATYQDLKLYFIVIDTKLNRAIYIDNLVKNENPNEKKHVEKLTKRMINAVVE